MSKFDEVDVWILDTVQASAPFSTSHTTKGIVVSCKGVAYVLVEGQLLEVGKQAFFLRRDLEEYVKWYFVDKLSVLRKQVSELEGFLDAI